jgi:hypothetical protein
LRVNQVKKNPLDSQWGEFAGLAALESAALHDGRFSVVEDEGRFDCYIVQKAVPRLFVLLSGARDPARNPLPKFDRWSWSGMYPGSVLCVSDPTLYLDPADLRIGWYVGTERHDWLKALARIVMSVATRLGVASSQIICYGSSAGGFGAMMLAAELGDATAVAINPQIDIADYLERLVQPFLDLAFGGRRHDMLDPDEMRRLSVIRRFKEVRGVKCLIAQNLQDKFHHESHFRKFCRAFGVPVDGGASPDGRFVSLIFDSDLGHGPEPKELAPELIERGVALSLQHGPVPEPGSPVSIPSLRIANDTAWVDLGPDGVAALELEAKVRDWPAESRASALVLFEFTDEVPLAVLRQAGISMSKVGPYMYLDRHVRNDALSLHVRLPVSRIRRIGFRLWSHKTAIFLDDLTVRHPVAAADEGAAGTRPRVAKAALHPRIGARQIYLLETKSVQIRKSVGAQFDFSAAGRKDIPPHTLTFPINWNADPFSDRNWCAQLQMWRMLDAHIYQHDKTRDPAWLKFPVKILNDWHRFHCVQKRPSRFAWKDMMVGLRAMKLGYVISQVQHKLVDVGPDMATVFEDLVREHLKFLLDIAHVSYCNHTFLDLQGAAALAQVVDDELRAEIYAFIDAVLPKLIASQFDEHGVHLENSPGYQPFGIACLARLSKSQWFGQFKLDELIARAREVSDWFQLPDGRLVPFGDTDGKPQDFSLTQTVFKGKRQVFNAAGYAIVRSDGDGDLRRASLLGVMAAFNSGFHKHADDLSFVWFEGEDILCDAGKFAYKVDPRREYAQSTRAHNTVEIDGRSYGENWSGHPELVYGSALGAVSVQDWGYLIDAGVRHRRFDVEHRRFFAYSPGDWVLVIDRLVGDAPHDFTQWFHFSPDLPDLERRADGYYTQLRNGSELRVTGAGNGVVEDTLEKGVEEPHLQGWISQAYGQLVPNCALGYRQRGNDVLFATLLSLDDEGSELVVEGNDGLLVKFRRRAQAANFHFAIDANACRVRRL